MENKALLSSNHTASSYTQDNAASNANNTPIPHSRSAAGADSGRSVPSSAARNSSTASSRGPHPPIDCRCPCFQVTRAGWIGWRFLLCSAALYGLCMVLVVVLPFHFSGTVTFTNQDVQAGFFYYCTGSGDGSSCHDLPGDDGGSNKVSAQALVVWYALLSLAVCVAVFLFRFVAPERINAWWWMTMVIANVAMVTFLVCAELSLYAFGEDLIQIHDVNPSVMFYLCGFLALGYLVCSVYLSWMVYASYPGGLICISHDRSIASDKSDSSAYVPPSTSESTAPDGTDRGEQAV